MLDCRQAQGPRKGDITGRRATPGRASDGPRPRSVARAPEIRSEPPCASSAAAVDHDGTADRGAEPALATVFLKRMVGRVPEGTR